MIELVLALAGVSSTITTSWRTPHVVALVSSAVGNMILLMRNRHAQSVCTLVASLTVLVLLGLLASPLRAQQFQYSGGSYVLPVFKSDAAAVDSYLRFFNIASSEGTVTVDIVGGDTGTLLGQWTTSIPANASIQFGINTIEQNATPAFTPPQDEQSYALYVTATFDGFVQHVLYNPVGGSLTNVSGCGAALSRSERYLGNVHTTQISGFPSSLYIHNASVADASAVFDIYDAADGEVIGEWESPAVPANTAQGFIADDILAETGFTPGDRQLHLNFILRPEFTGFAQHIVDNQLSGLLTNMTEKCQLFAQTESQAE